MSIDRIGKGTGVGATETSAPTAASGKKAFSVEGTEKTASAEATSPADAVRAGTMDMKTYVDLRVDQATAHLAGKLGPADLEQVRSLLRAQIADDPAVRELVKAATGAFPPSGDDA